MSHERFMLRIVARFGVAAALAAVAGTHAAAQTPLPESKGVRSAEIGDVRYDVTFDKLTAAQRMMKVTMTNGPRP